MRSDAAPCEERRRPGASEENRYFACNLAAAETTLFFFFFNLQNLRWYLPALCVSSVESHVRELNVTLVR
ncbi:hypothetical protein ILYODFUR_009389 [Ilyodon furcidens]|uniref:Uncharacterized protein n=1 Tax=Ilyodon furcidens TaxID=33524 RepID=A0ABV0UTE1_9TELE